MLAISIPVVLVTVMFLLTIPYQTSQGSLQITQVLASKNDTIYKNGTDDKTQIMINELKKFRTVLEENVPRQLVLSIVSFL